MTTPLHFQLGFEAEMVEQAHDELLRLHRLGCPIENMHVAQVYSVMVLQAADGLIRLGNHLRGADLRGDLHGLQELAAANLCKDKVSGD